MREKTKQRLIDELDRGHAELEEIIAQKDPRTRHEMIKKQLPNIISRNLAVIHKLEKGASLLTRGQRLWLRICSWF